MVLDPRRGSAGRHARHGYAAGHLCHAERAGRSVCHCGVSRDRTRLFRARILGRGERVSAPRIDPARRIRRSGAGRQRRGQFQCTGPVAGPEDQTAAGRCGLGTSRSIYLAGDGIHAGSAPVPGGGLILVAIPLPREFSRTVRQVEASQQRYFQLSRERRRVRQTYMGLLLLLTMMVLFVTTWLALFLAKLVTRPLSALAEATQEISRGRLDYRVPVS